MLVNLKLSPILHKYQQTENDMIDVKYDEDGEILAMSINLNVDGEMNPDDLKDFN